MRKNMAGEETNYEKYVKMRNHFVSNRFFVIFVKHEGKDAMKIKQFENCVKKHEKIAQGRETGAKGYKNEAKG